MEAKVQTDSRGAAPNQAQIDVYGASHPGLVRTENADHFLIASLHKSLTVHQTSLTAAQLGPLSSQSVGYVFLVADGVGSTSSGREASETALRAIVNYVLRSMDLFVRAAPEEQPTFLSEMKKSVEYGHEVVRAQAERQNVATMATTLTMVAVAWPCAYLIPVGDSRCYRLRDGRLEQLTTDQTMARALVESGAMSAERAEQSRLKHVLWSALGGETAAPETAMSDVRWDDVMLICSDGLTKHVTDEEIADELRRPVTSADSCKQLISLALARGGSDNVTVVVGRLRG